MNAAPNQSKFGYWLERAMFALGLAPLDDAVIFGSAVMKLHGLKEDIGDVDIFVPARVYGRLLHHNRRWSEQRPDALDPPFLESYHDDVAFHAFYAWTGRDRWISAPEAFHQARRTGPVMAIPLEMVAFHKQSALDVVRRWNCKTCCGIGVATCRGCAGSGEFRVAGSPWEKHEHDLAVLEASGVDLPTAICVQAIAHGAMEVAA